MAECAVVIEAAQAGAAATGEPFDEVLVKQLAQRPRQEILEYAERFDERHDALYRWDVWAAAYLIGGGCSDDSFMDFRAGVIALGCQWYQRVATDPGEGEAGGDGVEVLAEEAGEALHGLRRALLGLADPLQQQVSAPAAEQVGEDPGEVASPGDVRAASRT
ncbi:DUF4240 domain-containing protein [Streptomyces sp. NPDC002324]